MSTPAAPLAGVLLTLLLWPLALPGDLALRDMLVLDSPALSPSALGLGDLAARNVPQDGLLAVVGLLLPASWVARLLILAGGVAGVVGAVWLARLVGGGRLGACAAVTVVLWNPFVVERLLQGHWSLVIAGWLLPLIAAAALAGRWPVAWLAMWAASLTPTGGLLALVTGVAVARGRRGWTVLVGLACSLPWIIPGLLGGSTAAGDSVAAFAPRAEAHVGTLGALLGLGGVWNADAVPASRESGFALAGVALFALLLLGIRRVPVPLLVLAGLGLGGAVAAWLLPGPLAWAVAEIPGAGLLRDASKLTVLALPAYAALAASSRPWAAGLAIALALLQVPDAPRALAQLTPVHLDVDEELVARADGRDTLLVDHPPLIHRPDGRPVIHPLNKALAAVESGALVVDGEVVDQPSPRWVAAHQAWRAGDLDTLADLGVGVIVDGGRIVETTAPARPIWPGLLLLAGWLLIPPVLAAAARNARPSSPTRCR